MRWAHTGDGRVGIDRGIRVDSTAVRVAAVFRLAVAITAAAVGSFLPHVSGERAVVFFIVDLVWVPWAAVVLFASEQPGARVARLGGPIGDLLVIGLSQGLLAQAAVPNFDAAILPAYLVVVVFSVYTLERPAAVGIGVAAIAVPTVAQRLLPVTDRLGAAVLAPYAVAVVLLLLLIERTTRMQTRAASQYALLSSKADTILAHVADAILVTNAEGRILQSNPAVARIVGCADEPLVGRSCEELLGLHSGERRLDCSAGCGLLRSDLGDDAGLGVEVWRIGSNTERQPLLASASRVESDGGDVEVVHSIRDITRLKEAEEAKTLFLATASHELKTPLTVIHGFADTLVRYDDLDEEVRSAALNAIRARATELSRIVDRLLLSSRIEAGRLQLTCQELEIESLITSRVASFAAATGREVVASLEDLPTVVSNEDALITVVDHLIDNALKYSPGGEPVEVGAVCDAEWVQVEIADHGIGMDSEQAAHCFEKFWQAESSDVRRFGGTGIGLYIVQSLVEAMGGTASVSSERGAGSRFTLRLPRPRVPEPAEELTPTGDGEATSIREFMRQIGVPERRVR
ncbi:MAG TPA: PAS domain-containing sensor histidine kinase [Mycobacteriales bacterium]|nr:PAS domain-containing sensor histidine kinase [Mycobacteriales bacterium]